MNDVTTPLKVLLVGQNDETLASLRVVLTSEELDIAGTASMGPAALTWAKIVQPDLVVVVADESLARPVAAIQSLVQGDPTWTVVVLAEQFERELVRQAMLAGARDVLVRTGDPHELRQALRTARKADVARRGPTGNQAAHSAGTLITFAGVKGGIGKTMLAVNLALSLAAETSRSVALIDLDLPYGDVAMLLNVKPTGGVMSAVSDPTILADPDLLQAQMCDGPGGLHVLAAPLSGGGPTVNPAQIGPLLTRLAGLYDFVVVDTPGGFGEYTAAALDVSSVTMLVTTPEPPTLRRTALALRQLNDWKYPQTKLRVVVNRATLRTGLRTEEIQGLLGEPVTWWLPDEPRALEAAALGRPVALSQPKSEIARTLRKMARELGGIAAQPRKSLWPVWRSKTTLATAAG
jgi:pilus assembly protein CpaE